MVGGSVTGRDVAGCGHKTDTLVVAQAHSEEEAAVARGHVLCERVAADIVARLPQTTVFTHLEPREDPASFADQGLDSRPVEAGDREAARSSRRQTVRALGDRTGIGPGTP